MRAGGLSEQLLIMEQIVNHGKRNRVRLEP